MFKRLLGFTVILTMFCTVFSSQFVFSQDSSLGEIISVGTGDEHSVALKADGAVWVWGSNSYGQLGDGTKTSSKEPKELSTISNVIAIAAHNDHTMALKNDGTVWAWGDNEYGQLGNGVEIDSSNPVQVLGLSDVVTISAGGTHCAVLKKDGSVWTWGRNYYGQLGSYSTKNSSRPVQVVGISDVVTISIGERHNLALLKDGTVWAWGSNDYGELGNGTDELSSIPVQVAGLSDVTAIVAGNSFSAAVKSDGTLWVWGSNEYGQLGIGNTKNSLMPIKVNGLSNVNMLAAGDSHMTAIKGDGTVWSCGYNIKGQLGTGTKVQSIVPVQVRGITAVYISTTAKHSIVIKDDGSVWAWGNNYSSQIGDNFESEVLVPIQVIAAEQQETELQVPTQINEPTLDLFATPLMDSIDLSWDVSDMGDVDSYYIYRAKSSGEYAEPITDFPILQREYIDLKVEKGITYYYIVKAVLTNKRLSSPSNEVSEKIRESNSSNETSTSHVATVILQIDNPKMIVNGVSKEIDPGKGTTPVIIGDRTMIPIRAIIEELSGNVEWIDNERKVVVTLKDKKVEVWINKKTIKVNGKNKDIDVEPQIIKDRTMLPLRFVVENLGCGLEWDEFNNKITITYEGSGGVLSEDETDTETETETETNTNTTTGIGTNIDKSPNTNSATDDEAEGNINIEDVKDKGIIKDGAYFYEGKKIFHIIGTLDWAAMSPNRKYVVYRDGQYINYYDITSKKDVDLYELSLDEYMGKYVYSYGFIAPTNYDFVKWSDDSNFVIVKKWTTTIFKGGEGNYKINIEDKTMIPISE